MLQWLINLFKKPEKVVKKEVVAEVPKSGFLFSKRSKERLVGIKPELRILVYAALDSSTVDFGITEGLRGMERQRQLLADGKSTTLNSRHLTGHAVDVVAYLGSEVRWDWELYEEINKAFQQASEKTGIPYEWGGNWKTFKDGAHFQLPWDKYPK